MKITESKQVIQETTTGYTCDVCGVSITGYLPNTWHSFSHQHGDWGNDSHESRESFHVCSVGCFAHQLGKSLYEMKNNKNSAKISGMSYDFAEALYGRIK
jgi:hypothetical protein